MYVFNCTLYDHRRTSHFGIFVHNIVVLAEIVVDNFGNDWLVCLTRVRSTRKHLDVCLSLKTKNMTEVIAIMAII